MEGIHPDVVEPTTKKYLDPEASVKLATNKVCFQLINVHNPGILLIFPIRTVYLAIS